MGSIRVRQESRQLFLDFKFLHRRFREQTSLADTSANRKRLQRVLDKIESEIALGTFDYQKTFNKPLPMGSDTVDDGQSLLALTPAQSGHPSLTTPETRACATPLFKDFAMTWYAECEVAWRRTYRVTQLGAINQYLIPAFGEKEVGQIKKADVLNFRATLAKVTARKTQSTLSNRRINAVMKPLRQIRQGSPTSNHCDSNAATSSPSPSTMSKESSQTVALTFATTLPCDSSLACEAGKFTD